MQKYILVTWYLLPVTIIMEYTSPRALLPQSPYKRRTLKPYHIKYYWLIAVFLMMIAAIKVFINYATIQTSIEQVIKDTVSISRHKQYVALQAFVYRLPESEQFIAHDNGIVLRWERVFVKLQWTWSVLSWSVQTWEMLSPELTAKSLTPISSWIYYFSNKMKR